MNKTGVWMEGRMMMQKEVDQAPLHLLMLKQRDLSYSFVCQADLDLLDHLDLLQLLQLLTSH